MARFTKTMGTGIKMLGGANIPSYSLEFLTETQNYRKGSYQTIVVPYIELGRDSRCAIRFSENEPTVSRKHCSIEITGNEFKLTHLSKTNPTLINGRPVRKEWYLKNGDEIQLSMEGPKIRFTKSENIPSQIPIGTRIRMFVQQSIRPYRYAFIILLFLFCGLAGFGTYFYLTTEKTISENIQQIDKLKTIQDSLNNVLIQNEVIIKRLLNESKMTERQRDSLRNAISQHTEIIDSILVQTQKLLRRNEEMKATLQKNQKIIDSIHSKHYIDHGYSNIVQNLNPYVYKIETDSFSISKDNNTFIYSHTISGTGFLLESGEFITARHVIEPWSYPNDSASLNLNIIKSLGFIFDITFKVQGPNGQWFILRLDNAIVDTSGDIESIVYINDNLEITEPNPQANPIPIRIGTNINDWAIFNLRRSNIKGGLIPDVGATQNLNVGEKLLVLGYTYGITGTEIEPFVSEAFVGAPINGLISLSGMTFDFGNSGGPVFLINNQQARVIGIVESKYGDKIGCAIPISHPINYIRAVRIQ